MSHLKLLMIPRHMHYIIVKVLMIVHGDSESINNNTNTLVIVKVLIIILTHMVIYSESINDI